MNKELEALFAQESHDLEPFLIGRIPKHYKRITGTPQEQRRLAILGAKELCPAFNIKLYYSQAMIAGAILDPKYDEVVVVTSSQYGKSWLLGHIALYRAWKGAHQYIAAGTASLTQIIMGQTIAATQEADREIRRAMLEKSDDIDKLTSQLSKQRLAFTNGGFVEQMSLGDIYSNSLTQNKAVGRAGDTMVDEAALVSEQSFIELGRREFARIDGTKYKLILISNPHKPGAFYDKLTDPNPPDSTFILWMDALTAVEEERFTKEIVFNSDFAKHKSTLKRYLLCVLDEDGGGMFSMPTVREPLDDEYTQYFMGVDAAYKGKDSIMVTLTGCSGGKIVAEKTLKIEKKEWIDGVTSEDICREIAKWAFMMNVALICVDVGWGVWLVEGLKRRGLNVIGVNFSESPTRERQKKGHYAATNALNKRAEMHLDLQDLIESDTFQCTQEVLDKISDALPYITSERKGNGKIEICPKQQVKAIIGRSPDELDSVLLSVQAAIRFLGESSYAIT